MMIFTIISVTTFNRNDRHLFGYRAYVVTSDSMSKTDFDAGDLILVKEVDPATLKEGDIITYMSQNPESFGETITHKVRSLTTDANGNPGFITYGTTTDTDDATIVTYPYVLGRYEKEIRYGYAPRRADHARVSECIVRLRRAVYPAKPIYTGGGRDLCHEPDIRGTGRGRRGDRRGRITARDGALSDCDQPAVFADELEFIAKARPVL